MSMQGDQSRCIYCGRVLAVPTWPAHVFPNGAGGRLTTTTTVCNECNNSTSGIEGDFCLGLAQAGALAGARRGDRKPIAATIEHEAKKWHAEGGRMDEMAPPPREKGRVNPLPARREDQVRTIVSNLKSHGLPAEAMLDDRYTLEHEDAPPPESDTPAEPVVITWSLGERASKRVMYKIAIELLAYFDAQGACAPELDPVRRFVRYDEGEEWNFPMGVDTETTASQIAPVDAVLFHGIDVWTAGRNVHFRLTLFTELRVVGTLTEAWSGGPFSTRYTWDIKDPANNKVSLEPSDGARLVRKSRRVRDREMADALACMEETSLGNSERRRIRAPRPDFKDLYEDVCATMNKK
jgi:hypothetical protein